MAVLSRLNCRRYLHRASLAVLLLLSTGAWADQEAEQRARLKALKESIQTLQKELSSVKNNRSELLDELEQSEKAIGDLNAEVEKLQKQLDSQQQDLKQLHQRQSELQREKSAQQQHVGEHLNAAYRLGRQSNLRMLLNQEDPAQLARNLKYFDYITQARITRIERYAATLAELDTVEQDIESTAAQLRQNHSSLRQRHQQLSQRQEARRSTLQKLESTIASKDQELAQRQKDQERLQKLLQQISNVLDIRLPSNAGAFATLKGRLPWPLEGKVLQRYGSERAGRVRWQGLLIEADAGTPVRAIHHGRVVFSDYLRGHGLLLIVDHGTGFLSLYAHNQTLYKEIGEWVDSGEVIATVGSTGGRNEAALYFELRHQGQPTDPQKWIKAT